MSAGTYFTIKFLADNIPPTKLHEDDLLGFLAVKRSKISWKVQSKFEKQLQQIYCGSGELNIKLHGLESISCT